MHVLQWSVYDDVEPGDLAAELAALATHLDTWAGSRSDPPEGAAAIARLFRDAEIATVERLRQSFMPAVDVLRIRLRQGEDEREGIFLRQTITRGVPPLWPLLDTATNLYRFVDALPGVIDVSRETVLDYGTFFASEAVVGPDGPFIAFPDFDSLPDTHRDALRGRLADLKRQAEAAKDSWLLPATLSHVDSALAGSDGRSLSRLRYDRDSDQYFFAALIAYGTGLYAARILVSRIDGQPRMTDDEPLADVPPLERGARLPAQALGGALEKPVRPFPALGSTEGLRPVDGGEARRILLAGEALENASITGDLVFPVSTAVPSLRIRNCSIEGGLRLQGVRVAGECLLHEVRAGGEIDLRGARIERSLEVIELRQTSPSPAGLQLRGAWVGASLEINRCDLSGPLVLADTEVSAIVRLGSIRATRLYARRLSVARGPISIGQVATQAAPGPAEFGIITDGDINLQGASTPSWLAIQASHIGGACVLGDLRIGGGVAIGRPPGQRVFVKGDLTLDGGRIDGDIRIQVTQIGGSFFMSGTTVEGSILFGAGHGALWYRNPDCTIGKDLNLVHSEVKGPMNVRGVQIRSGLRLELCNLGAVIVEPRLVHDRDGDRVLTLLPARIRNRFEIIACEVRGEIRVSGAFVDEQYAGRYAIEITNTTVGQGISFWDEGLLEPKSSDSLADYVENLTRYIRERSAPERNEYYTPQEGVWDDEFNVPPVRRCELGEFDSRAPLGGWPLRVFKLPHRDPGAGADRESNEISVGELRTNLSARRIFAEVRGDVRMALCKIGGDLCLTNLHAPARRIVLESLEVRGDLVAESRGRRYNGAPGDTSTNAIEPLETHAAALEVSGSTIIGEARLAGLRLSGGTPPIPPSPTPTTESRATALAVRYSKVDGVLALTELSFAGGEAGDRSRAVLNGDLDVSWSTIDHLVLDGQSLGANGSGGTGNRSSRAPNRLVAASATIRKLELRDPLPGEVDLSDARVTVWDFGPLPGQELLRRFRNVLENQRPFKQNVFQEVEAYLHNAGFEDLAKTVHMDLVDRQHDDAIDRLGQPGAVGSWMARTAARARRALSRINRFVTGNFTSEWRPIFWCWLPLWLMSACYFADPARVDVGAVYRRNFAEDRGPICATLGDWSFWDGMKFTTRYVLPVVPSVGMDELDAADAIQAHPLCPQASNRIRSASTGPISRLRAAFDWFRPSTIATWVRVLSWLFLSLATGTIFAKMSRTPRASGSG